MSNINRRTFIQLAAGFAATAVWAQPFGRKSTMAWRESRDTYPEGVASGDPDSHSVILWTRHTPPASGKPMTLTVEVAEDSSFANVIAKRDLTVTADSDWTCRALVGGLKPRHVYWYRFIDQQGAGSRIGRTITTPGDDDTRPVRFTFVSCQNVNFGAQNAYRRMIFEDEKASPDDQLQFVLHLGDFIYEIVWYPEDRPQGYYDRRLREVVRYANGEKIQDFHIPTTVDDYRAVYKGYLHDPEIQDARARWPFVAMWDNHEFSWQGWQSLQVFDEKTRPAQTRKVAANQAFFEYQPARMKKPGGTLLDRFDAPKVADAPVTTFDANGLGTEKNNLTAINSLIGYRSLRFGKNVDLIITDQRSYRSEDPASRPETDKLGFDEFPSMAPEDVFEILDAGRVYNNGRPPANIKFGEVEIPNFRKDESPQTILGGEQKKWFFERLRDSKATWKVWGNSIGTLDMRADPQNIPAGITKPWPSESYALLGGGDFGAAYVERGEIYDFVRQNGVTGFATICGDRHSFWAGLATKSLPPKKFDPVGLAFITGSISAPGLVEKNEHVFPKDHPLRPLFVGQAPQDTHPQPTVNLLLRRGVRSCFEYAKSGDVHKAREVTNHDLSPHTSFVDMGGHGYSVVRASSDAFEVEFVCIARPIERSTAPDGGPVRYRVRHKASLWGRDSSPKLQTQVLDGDPQFSV